MQNGHVGIQGIVLENQSNSPVLRGQVRYIPVAEEDSPGGGGLQAADHIKRGALSAAGGAQQPDELPVRNLKGEVVHGGYLTAGFFVSVWEFFGQVLQGDIHSIPSFFVFLRVIICRKGGHCKENFTAARGLTGCLEKGIIKDHFHQETAMIQFTEITDFEAPELDVFARLTEAQLLNRFEPKKGMLIAESPKVIQRALDGGCVPVSLLVERGHCNEEAQAAIARCGDVPVYTASMDILTKLTGFQLTRGMLCAMLRPRQPAAEEILSSSRRVAVLENVMNPTNVGAIFRSAAALGMDGVLLTSGCTDPLYRRSARVSMGTVFQVPWAYVPDTWQALLKEKGFATAAMALREDSLSIDDPLLRQQEKLAVVLGTEGDGLAQQTIARCDYTVKIPMYHGVDSLNVAAASAVAFWELRAR